MWPDYQILLARDADDCLSQILSAVIQHMRFESSAYRSTGMENYYSILNAFINIWFMSRDLYSIFIDRQVI